MSTLPIGVHSISTQVITPTGVPTAFKEGFFYRMPTNAELSTLRAYYKIDDRFGGELDVTKSGSVNHLDVDCSALSSGIHCVSVFLASPYGLATTPQTAWFVKIPAGGLGVKTYEYWLNDNYENAKKVTLDEVANPLSILSLLDVDEEPFCSARYAFAIEDGVPVTYARNDFQIRFADPDNRMTSANGAYTDMRVRNLVENIEEIDRLDRNYIKTLPENTIKWYKFEGEVGDSISLKLDRGGMMELYSPSADKLVSAAGAEAVNYSSCQLTENGTYYIAVHDIANRNNYNVGLDFDLVRKFDIISNTPTAGSPRGDIYMDVFGNGFESLESLSLVKDDCTIVAKEFAAKDNYNLTAQFDLKAAAAPVGDYALVATYANSETGTRETVTRPGAFTVEEVKAADIQVKINTPFRPATPYEVTIDITNNSNTPCWGVPLSFAVRKSQKGFSISFKDFYPYQIPGLDWFVATDNLLGTHEAGYYFPTVIPYIGPQETITLTLGFRSDPMEKMRMYAWAGKPWSEEFDEILSPDFNLEEVASPKATNLLSARVLCYLYSLFLEMKEGVKEAKVPLFRVGRLVDAANLAQNNANLASAIGMTLGGITNGMRLRNLNASLEAAGFDPNDPNNPLADYQDQLKQGMPTPGAIIAEALDNEVAGHLADDLLQTAATSANPMPKPHDFICYQSGDPNEMKGYEAESGSTYIGHMVKTVDYTIEFENDPEIANASAMTISVENTIDGKVLELASFCPKSMKIGDKTLELPAEHKFVKTLDMRPEVNAIAELDFSYDASKGTAKWVIRSLDPLTMDETKYMTDGILPVNDDSGCGTGYLTYYIDLVDGLPDGTEIANSASIVFDNNPSIQTPVWSNITDYSLPVSAIEEMSTTDNMTFDFKVSGEDNGSGIWYYDLYVKTSGSEDWIPVMAQVETEEFSYTSEEPLEGAVFMVVAVDRAGNRQDDEIANILMGDADGNGVVDANDVVVMRNFYLGTISEINRAVSDVNRDGVIDAQDALTTRIIYLDTSILSTRKSTRIRR